MDILDDMGVSKLSANFFFKSELLLKKYLQITSEIGCLSWVLMHYTFYRCNNE